MQFKVFDGERVITTITAKNKQSARQILKNAGIRIQSDLIELIED